LSPLENFSILVAALVHDISHPGLNNNFQVATSSPLALRYNDRSVLENHHCTTAFTVMKKPENDFTCNLTSDQKKEMRNIIVNSVLATDLAQHMEIMAKWNSVVDDFSAEHKEHRLLLLQVLLKTADISNPGKPFELAKTWAHIIQEEMFIQVRNNLVL
jgi:high affinity cGMP-specific 3',5'-cyclic phosphodiesterase 9